MMKFHTRFTNLPPKKGVTFTKPSLTVQAEKDNTDIKNILDRFTRTGTFGSVIPGRAPARPMFGDFSDIPDFQTIQNQYARVSEYFDGLPSDLRYKFGNDPVKFSAWMSKEENYEEAVKLGLVEKRAVPVKTSSAAVQPSPSTQGSGESQNATAAPAV